MGQPRDTVPRDDHRPPMGKVLASIAVGLASLGVGIGAAVSEAGRGATSFAVLAGLVTNAVAAAAVVTIADRARRRSRLTMWHLLAVESVMVGPGSVAYVLDLEVGLALICGGVGAGALAHAWTGSGPSPRCPWPAAAGRRRQRRVSCRRQATKMQNGWPERSA